MLSGHDKAQLLLSMLGDRATSVLSLLSPENATLLTSTIGDSPKASPSVVSGLISEVMERVKVAREEINNSGLTPSADLTSALGGFLSSDSDSDSIFSSFGSDDASTGFSFGEDAPTDTSASQVPTGPKMRSPDEIAELLMKEKPQIAAFIVSRLDDGLRESVIDSFSYEFRDHLQRLKVDKVPLSDSVFKKIYDSIVMAPEGDPGDSIQSNDGFSSGGGLFG